MSTETEPIGSPLCARFPMGKNHPATRSVTLHRPGEDALVDVDIAPVKGVVGGNLSVMRADVSALPVPNKRYSADVGFVCYSRETIKWVFAQEKLGSDDLRTLLIVKMSPPAVVRFLTSVREAEPRFEDHAASCGLSNEDLPSFDVEEPKDTVTFDANFVLTAMSGREACADFYHSSPFAMGVTTKTKKLALDPIVRVDMRSTLLLSFVAELKTIVDKLSPNLTNENGYE